MGLRDLNSFDLALQPPPFETEPCKLILLIVDATADLTPEARLDLLTQKLTGYLSYVAAPTFPAEHPGLTPSDVIVRILTVHPPTEAMTKIKSVRLPDTTTRLRIFFDDYHAYMAKVKSSPR